MGCSLTGAAAWPLRVVGPLDRLERRGAPCGSVARGEQAAISEPERGPSSASCEPCALACVAAPERGRRGAIRPSGSSAGIVCGLVAAFGNLLPGGGLARRGADDGAEPERAPGAVGSAQAGVFAVVAARRRSAWIDRSRREFPEGEGTLSTGSTRCDRVRPDCHFRGRIPGNLVRFKRDPGQPPIRSPGACDRSSSCHSPMHHASLLALRRAAVRRLATRSGLHGRGVDRSQERPQSCASGFGSAATPIAGRASA